MDLIRNNYKIFALVFLVLNAIGVLLVIFSSFGGMTVATAYGPRDRYASLGSEYSEATDTIFIVLIAIGLITAALFSFIASRAADSNRSRVNKLASGVSGVTFILTIAGGVMYNVTRAEIGYIDWWLETGFYVGIIVSLFDTAFYGLLLRKV